MLSSEWPRGVEVGVDGAVHEAMRAMGVFLSAVGSDAVAKAAVAVARRRRERSTRKRDDKTRRARDASRDPAFARETERRLSP